MAIKHRSWLEEDHSKVQWAITSPQSEWPPQRIPAVHVAEDVERRELPCTLGGNVNRSIH